MYVREPAVTRGVTLPFFVINNVDITPVMTWLQTVNDVLGAAHGAGYSYLPSQNGIFPSGAELLRPRGTLYLSPYFQGHKYPGRSY